MDLLELRENLAKMIGGSIALLSPREDTITD